MSPQSAFLQKHSVAIYFGIVYVMAWGVWIPLAIARHGPAGEQVNLSLTLLAGAAPAVAATFTAWLAFGGEGVVNLWRRLFQWKINPVWYLSAFLIPAILPGLTAALIIQFAGRPSGFLADFQAVNILIGLLMYIPMALFEEIGWRGFAQPGLQMKMSALSSSVILGFGWSFWHLPYFLIPEFSFFPSNSIQDFIFGFGIYAVGTIPTCILMAWLFNNSNGSLIIPCIFHGVFNVFAGTFLIPLIKINGLFALVLSFGLSAVTAIIVLSIFGYRRLVRGSENAKDMAFSLVGR